MQGIKCGVASLVAFVAIISSASAAQVTVGSPLTGSFSSGTTLNEGTAINFALGAPGATATSPVSGMIVSWHLLDAEGGPFTLRVLRPAGGTSYTGAGSSNPVVAAGVGLQTFPTSIPIRAGDAVGLDLIKGNKLSSTAAPGSGAASWIPPLAEGSTRPFEGPASGAEFGFNAVVQPQPTITGLGPASGSFKGGAAVAINGTEFTGVKAVLFGPNAAVSFAVGSESQITAVAPPGTPGSVDVTVTALGGTSPVSAVDRFTYTACVVPNLNAKKLKAAKKKLKAAGCKVGKVTRKDGVSAKSGKVVKQGPKPGKKLAPGTKVNVTLG